MNAKPRTAYWRERSRRRRQLPEYRAKLKEWYADWYARNGKDPLRLKRKAELMREILARYPERARARRKLRTELESGRMKRGNCEVCGIANAHAHHNDYARPLEVRWLCRKHHDELHTKINHENTIRS